MHSDGQTSEILVVGLGPGDWSSLTIGSLDLLRSASTICFRTFVHPTVDPLRAMLSPTQRVISFDEYYERAESFDELYASIVDALVSLARASTEPVVYAVPGHPMIGERTVSQLLERRSQLGVSVRVFDAVSFVEPVVSALGIDPLSSSLAMLDGASLLAPASAAFADAWAGISPRLHTAGRPLLVGQVYDRRVASAVKLWLLERYPEGHQVIVVHGAGSVEQRLRDVTLAKLDHSEAFDHLTSIYVPPLEPLRDVRSLAAVSFIAARLRQADGCPWDRKQTLQSIKPHVLEEAHELVDALDRDDMEGVVEELGDVMLEVVLLSQIGDEGGDFDLTQVIETVARKLIQRHPHVFGDLQLSSAEEVLQNWEKRKTLERGAGRSALSGVPVSMPSLVASQVMQRKAAALGFEWPEIESVYAKVMEELNEVRTARPDAVLEEAGDLLFAIVSLCRHLSVDPDEALRKANAKFRRRFQAVESLCLARELTLASLDPRTLDTLWEEVKAGE
jgi:tetrapyrrole methylase family protein/MazG family protein